MKVQGLNFFPFPARLDDKVNLITLEYGAKGLGVYTMIMSQIFGGCGYYMPVEKYSILLIKRRLGLDVTDDIVKNVIEQCIKNGIFDREKFEKYKILTSVDILKDYLIAIKRRKDMEIIFEYIVESGMSELHEYLKPTAKNRLQIISLNGKCVQN